MEDPISEWKNKKINIEKEFNSNISDNNQKDNDKNETLKEEIINIINNINKDFDFKTFEVENIDIIEKVIKFI
jgi:hypothetical protein